MAKRARRPSDYCSEWYYKNKERIRERGLVYRKQMSTAKFLLTSAKHRAKQKGVPFALEEADIVVPEFCPVLGMVLERSVTGEYGATDCSPSLDRFEPSKGYVRGNVFVISSLANRIKSNAEPWQIQRVGEWCHRVQAAKLEKM